MSTGTARTRTGARIARRSAGSPLFPALTAGSGTRAPAAMPAPTREAGAAPAGAPVGDAASLPPLTAEDVASFCALGVEVKATSPEFGEMWLVPAYTGSGRKEITPEHLGVLHTVLREFPGARVESFESLRGAGGEPSP